MISRFERTERWVDFEKFFLFGIILGQISRTILRTYFGIYFWTILVPPPKRNPNWVQNLNCSFKKGMDPKWDLDLVRNGSHSNMLRLSQKGAKSLFGIYKIGMILRFSACPYIIQIGSTNNNKRVPKQHIPGHQKLVFGVFLEAPSFCEVSGPTYI